MAYALDPAQNPDEEEKKVSQYAALMAPAGGTAAAPAAAPAAPKAPSRPGFVNFDRYMSANQSTVDRMRSDAQRSLDTRADKVQSGLKTAESEIRAATPTAAPDPAGHTIVNSSVAEQQHEALTNGAATTLDEARNNAKTGTAPTAADVQSKYAPLLAETTTLRDQANALKQGDYSSVVRGATGFDNQLLGAAGGVNTSRVDGLRSAYDTSYGGAEKLAADGAQKNAENASKWQALIEKYEADQATNDAALADKAVERKNKKAEEDRFFNGLVQAGANREWLAAVFPKLTPDERATLSTAGPYTNTILQGLVARHLGVK